VQHLAEARQQARLCKDWAAADELRQQLEGLGWRVDDTPDGLKLKRKIG
jgi:cysteinyl-tRNA synthetase